MALTHDIKNFLYLWANKKRLVPPQYDFQEFKPMRANGTVSNQPECFIVEMRMGGETFVAKGVGKSKKDAQNKSARDMIKHLLNAGKMTRAEVGKVAGCQDLVNSPPDPQVKAKPKSRIEAMKMSYGNWKGGGVAKDGRVLSADEIVKEMGAAPEEAEQPPPSQQQQQKQPGPSHKRKRSNPTGEDIAFYGHKKTKVQNVAGGSCGDPITIDDDFGDAGGPSTSSYAGASLNVSSSTTDFHTDGPDTFLQQARSSAEGSESPEIVEVKNCSGDEDLDAHPFEEVIKKLRTQYPTQLTLLDEQIWLHFNQNKQDEQTFEWKMQVRRRLLEFLRAAIPQCRMYAVGSTINGCGSYNSDMDLCLALPDPYCGYDTERSYGMDVLRQVMRMLRSRQGREATGVQKIEMIPAKVPILKLTLMPPHEELEIDLNVNNVAGIYNSHLLHYYTIIYYSPLLRTDQAQWSKNNNNNKVDDRFPAICLLVKHWAIKADINEAVHGTFNSYSLILMVVHYLQCAVSPPVLPNLQYLFPHMFTGREDIAQLKLYQPFPAPIPGHRSNSQSVGELLIGFFDYFAKFDFDRKALSIRRSCVFNRSDLPRDTDKFKIFIEEPFDGKNTARCILKEHNMHKIVMEIKKAAKTLTRAAPALQNIAVNI